MHYANLAIPGVTSYANLWPLLIDEGPKGERYATTQELSAYTALWKIRCDNYQSSASTMFSENGSDAALGYSIVTGDDPQPESTLDVFKVKTGTKHKQFLERQLAGEIMMSNYEVGQITVKRDPKRFFKKPSNLPAVCTFSVLGVKDIPRGRGISLFPGTRCSALAASSVAFGYKRSAGNAEWRFPPNLLAQTVYDLVKSRKPAVKSIITETTAKANKQALDILTAAAELPETIKSVLDGFKALASYVKDLKKGKISASKAFEKRKIYLGRKLAADLAKIDNNRLGADNYRLKLLERHEKRVKETFSKAMKDSADELASSLASLWLNFRYNIMPNVYLVEDIEKALNKLGREWTTTRKRKVESFSIDVLGQPLDIDYELRCVIKRQFDLAYASIGNTVVSANVFVTAWELVTLSFVIDWFINVGDLLSAVTTPPSWKQQGASLSNRVELNHRLSYDDSRFSGTITISGAWYERLSINPYDYIGLCWQPDLSPVRQLDALALIWRPVRLILSNIRN